MKKKLSILLTFIIILSLFLSYLYYIDSIASYSNLIMKPLNESTIDDYFSDDIDKKSSAVKQIKESVLSDLGFESWMDYSEYMDVLVFPNDINKDNKIDLLIGLNLSKDSGVIAIYKKTNDDYEFYNSINNLGYITYISILKNSDYIIVEEIIDEKLGGFFYDKDIRIFHSDNSTYNEVFRESIEYESYYYEGWDNDKIENPIWYKITESNIIDVIPNNKEIIIDVNKTIKLYESDEETTSIPSNFNLIKEQNIVINYYWSDKFKFFIQNEGKIIESGELVGIISLSNQFADSLLNINESVYKIIDSQGKIRYLNKDSIEIIN